MSITGSEPSAPNIARKRNPAAHCRRFVSPISRPHKDPPDEQRSEPPNDEKGEHGDQGPPYPSVGEEDIRKDEGCGSYNTEQRKRDRSMHHSEPIRYGQIQLKALEN